MWISSFEEILDTVFKDSKIHSKQRSNIFSCFFEIPTFMLPIKSSIIESKEKKATDIF